MRAKIFFITLAVDYIGRSLAFYRDDPGWPTQGVVGQEFRDELTGADGTIAIFTLDDGLTLMLYERANLAKDASLPAGPPSSTEFSLGIPAESREEVDRLLTQAQAVGGHRHRTRPHAPVRRVLRVLHRPQRAPLRDRLELQPVVPHTRPRAWPPQHRIPPGRYPR